MDVMILVSSAESRDVFKGLAAALNRAEAKWGCFFTNDGAGLATDTDIVEILSGSNWANVCELSWERFGSGACPIELGSQTQNSMMMGDAVRVVSL